MQRKRTIPRTCQWCGEGFLARRDNSGLYCSRTCYDAFKTRPILDRFWAKVVKSADPDGCWLWAGEITPNGYGRINPGGGGTLYVHRFSYQTFRGNIPSGMDCCHRCDVRHCVRPEHLFLGTRADNMADMSLKGRGRGNGLIGERHPQAKLSPSTVQEIRVALAEGAQGRVIARSLGISESVVSSIKLRKTWAHVD